MPKVAKINLRTPIPLKIEIKKIKNPTKEIVKDLYGSFGLDIFEKKEPITIMSEKEIKKSKSIISKIKTWFTGNSIVDFEEDDTLRDVVFKYAANKKSGLVSDVEKMFGKKGLESFESLRSVGYVEV